MTPQEMEKLPKPLEKTITRLEIEVMGEVVDRIKKAYEIAPVGEHMLDRLTVLDRSSSSIKKLLKEKLEQANIDIDKIYDKAVEADYITHKNLFTKAGKEYIAYEDNEWLKQLVNATREQTKEELKPFENITRTTGFNSFVDGRKVFTPLSDYFAKSIDKSLIGIASGAYTYSQAMGFVIDEMTNSGLRVVNYASGKTDRIEVAARRALMTGVAQMTNQINESNAKKLDTDYFEVDWHPGARNKGAGIENHQAWQGKVYSKQEMITICGEGDILGFAGINCYHIKWPFIKGISKRKYTDEWLKEQNEKENTPKEFNGKEYTVYDALQYQRKLERTIRKLKQDVLLLSRAEVDKDVLIAKKSKLQSVKALYAEFSKAMGLPQQMERLRGSNVYNYKGFKFPEVKLGTGTSDSNNDNGSVLPPEKIGTIDPVNTDKAIEYYNDKIRYSDIENAIIIDRYGNVYYTKGDEDSVMFGGIDLTGATITHNHPESNGIVSFGEDDFVFIRDNPGIKELFAVNPEYTYSVKVTSDMSKLFYSEYNRKAMLEAEFTPDFDIQHKVFEILDREGKVKYAREKYNP